MWGVASSVHAAPTLQLASAGLQLEIDFALDGGHVRLIDHVNDHIWSAVDFGVIRAWDVTEDRMRTLIISPGAATSRCEVTIERRGDTQAVVHVDTGRGSTSPMGQMSFGVAFDVELTLNDHSFEYAILIDTLREQHIAEDIPPRWRLMNVELFPHLGATPAGTPGYLVIPSWSGGLYYFDRSHPMTNPQFTTPGYGDLGTEAGVNVRWSFDPEAPAEYGSMIYGIQAAWEDQLQLPIYGTIRDRAGLAGIVLSGEYDTELRARRHQGVGDTASINPIFHYRRWWHSKLDPVDRRVRLVALGPDRASYAGIANLYRDHLLHEKGVKTLRQRAETNPEVAYFLGGQYCRVMMGMKQSSMTGDGQMRSTMSWDDFADSVSLFEDAGFDKINFVFVGGNYEGHDGAHPTVFPIEQAHGGEEGLRRLIKRLNEAGYRATFHLNYKDCYKCSPDWDPSFIQVNEYGELRYHGAWIGGFSYQGIPQEMLERFGKRDLPRLRALGLRGMHYWDASLSVMEETFPPNRVITRREYGEGALAYYRYAAEVFGTVGCETSIAPLLGTVTNILNVSYPNGGRPGKFTANGYCEAALLDHWVPMQHMVYHGLVTYGGGAEVGGRAGYEFNAKPTREEVTKIRQRYEQHLEWGGELELEFITDHRAVAHLVHRTTFSDGTRIWVNKTSERFVGDGATVEPGRHVIQRSRRQASP